MHDSVAVKNFSGRGRSFPRMLAIALTWVALHAHAVSAPASSAPGAGPESHLLDVGLVVFDPGVPADSSTHSDRGIFPRIRQAEAKYMPVMLRQILIRSEDWGVVRVLPEAQVSSELLVTGTILHSDGRRLELHIEARDATGMQWLDKTYREKATAADYAAGTSGKPFRELYSRVAADLLAFGQQQTAGETRMIQRVALLRYASELAPQVFSPYLETTPEDRHTLVRLPSENDPMMGRIMRVRKQEYLFIDTIDEQYADLADAMAPTYNLWRQFHAEQAEYRERYEARVNNRDSGERRGSFTHLKQTYNAYKWSRIHQQDLEEVARGFNNEVAPTVMHASGMVFELSGTLDRQYTEWRAILRRIFTLETGLTPAP